MEKEVILTEQTRAKEDTIASIKLGKEIQDTLETSTGWVELGYRSNNLYYALPNDAGWSIYTKQIWQESKNLFQIKDWTLTSDSLDIYEGHMALRNQDSISFYALSDGRETVFKMSGDILSIKDSLDTDMKIITTGAWVFMYSVSQQLGEENPLYDDIIQLQTGEIVALIKKSSKIKQSLLSLDDTSNDNVLLIGQDTRERRTLFRTPKNGKMLRYTDGKILFIDDQNEVFVVENVK